MTSFDDKLRAAIETNDSLLCVGLDPDLGRMPVAYAEDRTPAEAAEQFCLDIIAQTSDLVCCYKPNCAFFEQHGGEGVAALKRVIAAVPERVPVLLDAKRGDIGNTAAAYARAAYEDLGADAVTVSPYLGADSVAPFVSYDDKAVFLLCHTSNPSSADVQHHGIEPLYQHIAREAQAWGAPEQIAFVVGATQPEALAKVRELAPTAWILAPGVGAQGGDLGLALSAGLDAEGLGVIVPVSRGVLYADSPRAAAIALRDGINAARKTARRSAPPHAELIKGLYDAGCVRFGEFTMASGMQSPIYVDLRRVVSDPALFKRVVVAYATLLKPLRYDLIAGVPYAALPTGAGLALHLHQPLIYPRKEVKAYGTGRSIEGSFAAGQTALVIEDVVTSAGSLLKAIDRLEVAELVVRDVAVLVDREQGGGVRLSDRGYRLHAVLTIGELLDGLLAQGCVSRADYDRAQAYFSGQPA